MPGEEWSLAHLFIGNENRMKINGLQVQLEELRNSLRNVPQMR